MSRRTVSESSVGSVERGIDLLSAIQKKYSTSSMRSFHCIIYVTPNAPGKTKSGTFRVPENLTLDSFNISMAGNPDDLHKEFANVIELDLTGNAICDWSEVGIILRSIHKLEFLNLTSNPLKPYPGSEGFMSTSDTYKNLKRLALNFTSIPWSTVDKLLVCLPHLNELYLSGNGYTDVDLTREDNSAYTSLQLLQLTSNNIQSWSDIQTLGKVFPNITTLVLASNPIQKCGNKEDNMKIFTKLHTLNMNGTQIEEWDKLEGIACIEKLQDIRLSSIPLLDGLTELKRRQLLYIYFPRVKKLNGSVIMTDEREPAESIFLRHFQDMESEKQPSRYRDLERRLGKVQPLANVNMQPEEMIKMNVVIGEKNETMPIPTKVTIGQLRRKLKSAVGSSKFRLFHQTSYGSIAEIKQNNRFVWAFNFREGDTLLCNS